MKYADLIKALESKKQPKELITRIHDGDISIQLTELETKLLEYVIVLTTGLDEIETLVINYDDTSDKESMQLLVEKVIPVSHEHKELIKEIEKLLLD